MVKVFRDEPEFVGGPLTAEIPESSLEEAKDNGWKVAEKPVKKDEPKVEKPVEEPKVEEPKVEKPKAPKKKLD